MENTEKTSAKFVDQAIERFKNDIEINKNLSGINFSSFLGNVLNVVSNIIFRINVGVVNSRDFITSRDKMEDLYYYDTGTNPDIRICDKEAIRNMLTIISFGVISTMEYITHCNPDKTFYFSDTSKGIVTISFLQCRDIEVELERIEKFVAELMHVQEDLELNHNATKFFLGLLK